jgi:hypothetical protein
MLRCHITFFPGRLQLMVLGMVGQCMAPTYGEVRLPS